MSNYNQKTSRYNQCNQLVNEETRFKRCNKPKILASNYCKVHAPGHVSKTLSNTVMDINQANRIKQFESSVNNEICKESGIDDLENVVNSVEKINLNEETKPNKTYIENKAPSIDIYPIHIPTSLLNQPLSSHNSIYDATNQNVIQYCNKSSKTYSEAVKYSSGNVKTNREKSFITNISANYKQKINYRELNSKW